MSRVGRTSITAAFAVLCFLAALFALWDVVAPPVIEAAAAGRAVPVVGGLLDAHRRQDPARRDVAYYVRNGRTALGRAILLATAGALLVVAAVRRRQVAAATRAYFTTPGPALNLAVFRIVLFGIFLLNVEWTPIRFYAQLPPVLQRPPTGLNWLPELLPPTTGTVDLVLIVFRVSCILAILGLFTRPVMIVALITGAYAVAIPQLFKIYSDHHVLWFAALLAVSPCADVLSLDALLARRGGGAAAPPPPSLAYALPLRFVWLLFGAIYFFPGLWKLWMTGLAWVSPDNLQHHMFQKWHEFGDWTPPLRIDHLPLLLLVGAIGTVLFEIGFAGLVLSSRLRPIAAAAGLVFHNLTWFFFGISFWFLQLAYVALIDWDALVRRVRRRVPLDGAAAAAREGFPWATAAIGSVLVAGAVAAGAGLLTMSWPFMCYPSFAHVANTTRAAMVVEVADASGGEHEVDLQRLNAGLPQRFEHERLYGLVDKMLDLDPAAREEKLRALWGVLAPGDPALHGASAVRFYREVVNVIPERRHEEPLARELLLELRVPHGTS